MKKYFCAALLTAAVLAGAACCDVESSGNVYAEEGNFVYSEEINGTLYTLDDDGVFICSGSGEVESRYAAISFKDRIKKAVIGEGMTYIGPVAFYGCEALTEVTLPDTVTSIGLMAFHGCKSLETVNIPESVEFIEEMAFENTAFYESFEDGAVYMGNVLYKYKGDMPENTRFEIREGTCAVSSAAFSGCKGLTEIIIPGSVKKIGSRTFENCSGLESVIIPDGVSSLDPAVFSGCSKLKEITIPASVTEIKPGAFSGCDLLDKIHGEEGSSAQIYAEENGYEFIAHMAEPAVSGDADGDGSVTVSDAMTLIKYLFSGSEDICIKCADMDQNGKINIIDLILLKSCLLK